MMLEIQEMINNLGFPVACVFGLAWYVNKIHKETVSLQQKQMEESNKVINEARETNRELLFANKELLETNRTLTESISFKVDNIENNILEIKSELKK